MRTWLGKRVNKRRKLSESVRYARWIVVFVIFVLVGAYQFLTEIVFDFSQNQRLIASFVIFAGGGGLITWVSIIWASRRIAAGEAARQMAMEKEKLLSSIVSESAEAIFSTDLDGIITSWNRGAEYIFGYTSEEMVGQNFSKLIPGDLLDAGEIERLQNEFRIKGYMKNVVTERLTKDGRRITVEITRTALKDEEGRHYSNSSILRDITERKEAEQLVRDMNLELEEKVTRRTANLRQAYLRLERTNMELQNANEKLKELDRMKSEFVSMVSHALRAPITNINGAIELLSYPDTPLDSDEGRDLFDIIQAESARLTRLVQDVLSVSRFESGRIGIYSESVDVREISRRVVQNMRPTTDIHRIILSDPGDLPLAWADRDYTEEILVNLIDNAIKYSPEGGTIEVVLESKGGFIVVSVSDQGMGIGEKNILKVFDSFYRVDGSDHVAIEGHGLGLYVAKNMVESQGGTIMGESVLGEGTTFTFTLPVEGKQKD